MEKGTIKIRFTPSEIQELNLNKKLEQELYLSATNQFTYSVNVKKEIAKSNANFSQYGLLVEIPEIQADKWVNSNQVGIKETIVTENGEEIKLTLEEDLPPRKHKKSE